MLSVASRVSPWPTTGERLATIDRGPNVEVAPQRQSLGELGSGQV